MNGALDLKAFFPFSAFGEALALLYSAYRQAINDQVMPAREAAC